MYTVLKNIVYLWKSQKTKACSGTSQFCSVNDNIFARTHKHPQLRFVLVLFSGYYLHHLDDKLSVKKLELHLRPPEEYIFHVHSHGNTCLQKHPKEETDFRRSAECRNIFSGSKLSDISSTVNIRKQNGYCQSCVHQGNTKCMYINQSDHSDKYTMDEYQYSLSSLNGDVIKLGLPSRTHTEIVKTREKSPMQKPSQSKRDSFYKVVSLAGSCFGFVRKTQNWNFTSLLSSLKINQNTIIVTSRQHQADYLVFIQLVNWQLNEIHVNMQFQRTTTLKVIFWDVVNLEH